MTLPFERTTAVLWARVFLCDLLDPQATPKVPKWIRERARGCLRHYPTPFDMKQLAEVKQHVFGQSIYTDSDP